MMNIRKSTLSDLERMMHVYDEARRIMRGDGNMHQWTGGYPDESIIRDDIERGVSYVMEKSGQIVAAFAFIPGIDETYLNIHDGAWIEDNSPYGTIHRLGSLPDVKGVARACFDWCWSQIPNLRADTHEDNRRMQRVLLRSGFRYCGIIYLKNGDPRLAYQKTSDVRKADLSDIPLIRKMAEESFRKTYRTILSRSQIDYMMDMMYSERSLLDQMTWREDEFFISEGRGYVSIRPDWTADGDMMTYHLEKLYVMPGEQGQGVGRELFSIATAYARYLSGAPCRIELNVNRSNPAVGFYEHLGMKKSRSGDFPIGKGYFMNDYLMCIIC